MDDQPTCGKGLAERSALPAKLAELTASMAEVLEGHQTSLDLKDQNARKEHEVYGKLAKEYRGIANQLKATAERMAGVRDLPMGRHDVQALASPKAIDVFARFVRIERQLLDLLQTALGADKDMLVQMRGGREP